METATSYPLFKFIVDGVMYGKCVTEQYISRRVRDWHHKQRLSTLPTWQEKLNYWRDEVCKDNLEFSVTYLQDSNFPLKLEPYQIVQLDCSIDIYEEFKLTLEPKNMAQRKDVHQFWVNWYRSNKEYLGRNPDQIFSFEELKASLQRRLLTAIHKQELLDSQLRKTSKAIEEKRINSPSLSVVIDELRDCWIGNSEDEYSFSFDDTDDKMGKDYRLAIVWDIVRYEAYLKDCLTKVEKGLPNNVSIENENSVVKSKVPKILKPTKFEELFSSKLELDQCVKLLQNSEPPYIGKSLNWIGGGNKAVIVGWINALRGEGKIKHVVNANLPKLLTDFFPGLTIDPTTFGTAKDKCSLYQIGFESQLK